MDRLGPIPGERDAVPVVGVRGESAQFLAALQVPTHQLVAEAARDAVRPSGEKATLVTEVSCPDNVCNSSPSGSFQSLMSLSPPPERALRPSGEKATLLTPRMCPGSESFSLPVSRSQSRAVSSSLPRGRPPVGREADAPHAQRVPGDGPLLDAAHQVPQLHGVVVAGGEGRPPVGREAGIPDGQGVPGEHPLRHAADQVPDGARYCPCRRKSPIGRRARRRRTRCPPNGRGTSSTREVNRRRGSTGSASRATKAGPVAATRRATASGSSANSWTARPASGHRPAR